MVTTLLAAIGMIVFGLLGALTYEVWSESPLKYRLGKWKAERNKTKTWKDTKEFIKNLKEVAPCPKHGNKPKHD